MNYRERPAAPGAEHPGVADASTRERVLQKVSESGPVTVAELCLALGLTDTAIRRHLDGLHGEGLIEPRDVRRPVRRGRGRPARGWVVSSAGHAELGADYDDLASDALRFVAAHLGSDSVAQFAEMRVARIEKRYAAELAEVGDDTRERAQALVAALSRDGYAASLRPVEGAPGLSGLQLCQGHCPVQHVAAQFPQFCDAETDTFSRLLGVHVQRLATLAHGDHVCTTFVPTPQGALPQDTQNTPALLHPSDNPSERSTS